MACKQTSNQRLKAIQLLLRIVATQRECLSTTHPKTPPSPGHKNDFLSLPPPLDPTPPPRLQTDLSLLRPLWVLYNKMTGGKEDCHTMQQSVVRALTELFLQVENLALVRNFWHLLKTLVCFFSLYFFHFHVGFQRSKTAFLNHTLTYFTEALL